MIGLPVQKTPKYDKVKVSSGMSGPQKFLGKVALITGKRNPIKYVLK